MNIIEIAKILDISIGEVSLVIVAALTLVQVAPIQVNPWSWLARKIGQAVNGDLTEKVDRLEVRLAAIDEKTDKQVAINRRVRILKFNDELQQGLNHSKESFDQVLQDITDYETYCATHPDFKNNQTVETVAYIKKCYAERLEKHDFL